MAIKLEYYKLLPPDVPGEANIVDMPSKHKILGMELLNGAPHMLAMIDDSSLIVKTKFLFVLHGSKITPSLWDSEYIASMQMTAQQPGQVYMVHLFKIAGPQLIVR